MKTRSRSLILVIGAADAQTGRDGLPESGRERKHSVPRESGWAGVGRSALAPKVSWRALTLPNLAGIAPRSCEEESRSSRLEPVPLTIQPEPVRFCRSSSAVIL
jgi:hypothetical protein